MFRNSTRGDRSDFGDKRADELADINSIAYMFSIKSQ